MNYLELARRLRRKCRVSGTGPSAVTNQPEEYSRLLDWVNEAYIAILRMHPDWNFMRASCSCATVQGKLNYSASTDFALTDFGYWALDYANGDTFRNYDTTAGANSEIAMSLSDYDSWRDTYYLGAMRSTFTRPNEIAQAPDRTLVTGPIAAAGYTLVGDYYRVPVEMSTATQSPVFDSQFHMSVVYKAMTYYGSSEAAPEVFDEGQQEFDKIIRQMQAIYLRPTRLAGALA